MTNLQKTILHIADHAKENKLDPITAVQEYFDSKDSHLPRAKIITIVALAREEQRKDARKLEAVK